MPLPIAPRDRFTAWTSVVMTVSPPSSQVTLRSNESLAGIPPGTRRSPASTSSFPPSTESVSAGNRKVSAGYRHGTDGDASISGGFLWSTAAIDRSTTVTEANPPALSVTRADFRVRRREPTRRRRLSSEQRRRHLDFRRMTSGKPRRLADSRRRPSGIRRFSSCRPRRLL